MVWQDITLSGERTMEVVGVTMMDNHSYLASCSQFDKNRGLVELSQIKFSYPLADKPDPTVSK